MITKEALVNIIPECSHVADKYLPHLLEAFDRFDISSPLRQAAFLAQVGHESTRLTRVEENLNYSANGLIRTFPNHFTADTAKDFAYKPMKIANKVYANLLGNGPEDSGDGWRYRGRGLIQVTLRNNYRDCSKRLTGDEKEFLQNPDLLLQPEWAVRSACDFWDHNHLSVYADENSLSDFKDMTKKINRALRGLDDRVFLWRRAKDVLEVSDSETP